MFSQIPIDNWQKGLADIPLVLRLAPHDIGKGKYRFERDSYDRGEILVALFANLNHQQFGLMSFLAEDIHGTEVHIPMNITNKVCFIMEILEFLELDLDDVSWKRNDLNFSHIQKWDLHRADDNGNSFLVKTFTTKSKALRIGQAFESKGHKQLYFVTPSSL